MAVPRTVARDLRRTASKLARVRDDAVRESATSVIESATSIGGRMRGRTLTAYVKSTTNRGDASTVVVAGKPAGWWAIKSYGRRGGYDSRPRGDKPLDLRTAGTGETSAAWSVHVATATHGDGRWDRVIEAADTATVDAVTRLVDGVLTSA